MHLKFCRKFVREPSALFPAEELLSRSRRALLEMTWVRPNESKAQNTQILAAFFSAIFAGILLRFLRLIAFEVL